MKGLKLLFTGALVMGMLFSTAIVLASPAALDDGLKPAKTITPGAKATEKAVERGPDQPGKKNEPSKAPEKIPPSKGPKGPVLVYQGIVDSVESQSFTLELANSNTVTFTISNTVKVNVQGVGQATLADVEVGARATVQARKVADGSLIAISISVFRSKSEKQQRVGLVTEYIPGVSITISGKAGLHNRGGVTTTFSITTTNGITMTNGITGTNGITPTHGITMTTYGITTTYALTANTKILPANRASQLTVGMTVTIIAPSAASKGGRLVAQGIVIHPATTTDVDEMEPSD